MTKQLVEEVEPQLTLAADPEVIRVPVFMDSELHDFEVEEIGSLLSLHQFNLDTLTLSLE